MNTAQITLVSTAQPLTYYIDLPRQVSWIGIQNPGSNACYVGGEGRQDWEVAASGGNHKFPESSLKNVWIRGTTSDTINIAWGYQD